MMIANKLMEVFLNQSKKNNYIGSEDFLSENIYNKFIQSIKMLLCNDIFKLYLIYA